MQVPFDSIKQQVWDEIRHGMKLSNHTESFWENVQAFAHAVDWKASLCYSRSSSSSLLHAAVDGGLFAAADNFKSWGCVSAQVSK